MKFFNKLSELILGKASNDNTNVNSSFGKLSIYDSNATEKNNEQKAIFLSKTSRKAMPLYNSDDKYPSTLRFWYDIKNIRQLHVQLINEGYYRESTIKEILDAKTIPEIKELANKYNILAKGNKKDIINQVVEGLNNEQKNSIVSQTRLYSISDKGNDYIERYKDFLILAENYTWDIDLKRLNKLKNEYINITDIYELAILDLEKRIPIYNQNKEYSKACVSIIALEKIYLDKEDFSKAMEKYLSQVLYDINFATYQSYGYELAKDSILSSLEHYIKNGGGCIAPANIKNINKYGEEIDDNMISKVFYEYSKSFYYLVDLQMFKDLIYAIIGNDFIEVEYLKRFYKNVK